MSGVFRIWLEHPPAANAIQTEAQRVPWFANSNPDHQVELHPITAIGSLDFLGHIKRIRAGTQSYTGYGTTELVTILNKKLTIQRITIQGVSYSVIGVEVIAVPTHASSEAIRELGASPPVLFPVVTDGNDDIVATYRMFAPGPHAEILIDRQGYIRASKERKGDGSGLNPTAAEA